MTHTGCAAAYYGSDIVVAEVEAELPRSVTMYRRYTCGACHATLTLRRTKHERYSVPAFFAHNATGDGCTGGGPETQAHLQCKYYLKEFVGHYGFCLEKCKECREKLLSMETESTDSVQVEQAVRIDGRLYRYDTLIYRKGCPRVAVEVVHTHKTKDVKITDTRECGLALVEVHTSALLDRLDLLRRAKAGGASVELPNALVVWSMCAPCEDRKQKREAEERVRTQERAQAHAQAQAQARERAQAQAQARATALEQDEQARQAERKAERKASAQRSEPAMLERAKFMARAQRWPDSWFRLVVVVSEQDAAMAQEHWRLWHKRERDEDVRQHKKLQRKAFRQAEEAEEACRPLREQPNAPYAKTNFKCVECDRWRVCYPAHIQDSKWPPSHYQDLHPWHVDNRRPVPETARCCRACVVECPKCGEWYPLRGALRFGLCRDCNVEFKI